MNRSGVRPWIVGVGAALSVSSGAAAQWPQWRGPGGLGISDERDLPIEWSVGSSDAPAKNMLWTTEIPGRGHSSPIVWNNRIFLTTSIRGEQVPGRKAPVHLGFDRRPGYVHPDSTDVDYKHALRVLAIDASSGTIVWDHVAFDGVMADDRHRKNTYASSTMAADGERVYAFFESAGLYAYTFDGALAWKKDLGGIIKAGLGPGTSPVIYKDLIILQCDQEMGDGSYIVALNRRTGDEAWRAARTNRRSWATPLIVHRDARDELIASGAESVIAYDPATGKELWRASGTVSHPIPSPVATQGLVFMSAGSQSKVAFAVQPDGTVAWRYNKGTAYVPSPIAVGEYVYFITDAGLMTCMDAVTGERKYEGGRVPIPATFFASPVSYNGFVVLTSEDGDSFFIRTGPVHEVVRTNTVGEPVYASPAIANGTIYIRGERHLFAIRNVESRH